MKIKYNGKQVTCRNNNTSKSRTAKNYCPDCKMKVRSAGHKNADGKCVNKLFNK